LKIYLRTLWANDPKSLWSNEAQREGLRKCLNDEGFYVLTGAGDSLEVYAIDYTEAWDIRLAKKALDKCEKVWYTLIRKQKEATQ
jgi:hypothetical protein